MNTIHLMGEENSNHLEPTKLKITGTNNKPTRLYKYIGVTAGQDWDKVKDYLLYITPEFVLRNGVTGFEDYGDIGWYCKHKDVFIVEQRLEVPLHLTVGYRERIKRTEAEGWYNSMNHQHQETVERLHEIKSWFTEAVYPAEVRDYIGDIINSSRVYLPSREHFFDEGGTCFLVREDQDFIAMFVNLEFSRRLGNCRGVLDGIFCYLDFDPDLADMINDVCVDETDEFRVLFVKGREHYAFRHDPPLRPHHGHSHPRRCPYKCRKSFPWEYDKCHY